MTAFETLVHREALARPIHRIAEDAHLPLDRPAGMGLPLPDALDEFLAAQVATAHAFKRELIFDDLLRGDSGMICPREPQHAVAGHPTPSRQRVLQGVVERVANV